MENYIEFIRLWKKSKKNAANSYERGEERIDLHEVRRNLYLSRQLATNSFPKRSSLHDFNQLGQIKGVEIHYSGSSEVYYF